MRLVQLLRAVALAVLMMFSMPTAAQAQTDLSGLWTGQSSGNQVRLEMRSGGFAQMLAGTQNAGQAAGEFFFRDAGSGQYLYTKPDGNDVRVQVLGPDTIRVTNPDGWTDVFTRPAQAAALDLPSDPVSAADRPASYYPELTRSDIAVCRAEFAALQADAVEYFRRSAASYAPGGRYFKPNDSSGIHANNVRVYTKSANEMEARDPLDLYVEGVGAAGPGGGEGDGYGNLAVANELWRTEEGLGYYQRDANASVPPRDASKLEYNLYTEASDAAARKCVARVFLTKYYAMHPKGAPADFAPAKRQTSADGRSPIMEEAWNGVGEPPKSPAPATKVGVKGKKDRPVPHLSDDQKVLNEILRLTTPSARKTEADARFEVALLEYEQKLATQQKAVAEFEAAQRQMAADKAAAAARASAAQQEFARQQAAYQAEQDRYAREQAEYQAQLTGQPVPAGGGNGNNQSTSGPGGGTTVPPLRPTATLEDHNPANEASHCLDLIINRDFEARGVSSVMGAVFRNSCPFPVETRWCIGANRCATGYDNLATMPASNDRGISYDEPAPGTTIETRWAGCRLGFVYRPDFAGTLHYACK